MASWKFFGGNGPDVNAMVAVGSIAKGGFETVFMASKNLWYGYAEALDVHGRVLGVSPIVKTFVPYSAPASNLTAPINLTYVGASTPPLYAVPVHPRKARLFE